MREDDEGQGDDIFSQAKPVFLLAGFEHYLTVSTKFVYAHDPNMLDKNVV